MDDPRAGQAGIEHGAEASSHGKVPRVAPPAATARPAAKPAGPEGGPAASEAKPAATSAKPAVRPKSAAKRQAAAGVQPKAAMKVKATPGSAATRPGAKPAASPAQAGPGPANGRNGEVPSVGQAAAEALEPEAGLFDVLDPLSLGPALLKLSARLATNPAALVDAGSRFANNLTRGAIGIVARSFGVRPAPPLAPASKDRRFSDKAWDGNPLFFGHEQLYLAWAHLVEDLVHSGGLERSDEAKAEFALGMLVDALAPTNFLVTNPAALRKAIETHGLSLVKGFRNFLTDLVEHGGMPQQVDRSKFVVGRDLAATPGKVVFRNDLMELIQYAPQTETVYEVPMLVSPPWINKFYLMDLAPGRSFIEWAVTHGHSVFAISYRNPDESMRGVSLDDYLINGPLTALDVIADITGSRRVNISALCIGGTLTAMLLAYLKARGDDRIQAVTLLNTLTDFSEPGILGVFTDPASISKLERRMAAQGFLPAADMEMAFNSLRANDLIWSYVAANWLMGEDPPAFDILAWNADSTRLPASMHSFYLRSCYQENQLARGVMEVAGEILDLSRVTSDLYIVGAVEDHIVPWTAAYRTTQLVGGQCRFVLTSSGHVAGVVNPPGGKRKYWTNDQLPAEARQWRAEATEHPGSWWNDWAPWLGERAGGRRTPPPMGSAAHPAGDNAPGGYVHG
jgi:polyhydroxyalkanoate synthase